MWLVSEGGRQALCWALVVALGACGGDDDGGTDAGMSDVGPRVDAPGVDTGTGDMCGDERRGGLVYFGTPEPTALPLSTGQVQAIGTWGGCSGTFVTEDWVLTANHCRVGIGDRFCVGVEPRTPNVCFTAAEVRSHPSQDMTLARMDAFLSDRLATAEPIPINTQTLDGTFLGDTAEAAGYGQQEDGSSGEREFTAEPIDGYEGEFVVINGEGTRGVCFGDSGGPVMILADDGTVRVAGDLSYGDPTCLGRDRYSRTDLAVSWIETYTGPTIASGSCDRLGTEGLCVSAQAVWCEGEDVRMERCDGACGWDADVEGYRCLTGADPCEGVDPAGDCDGDTARWCERGVLRQRDCAACDQVCGNVSEVGGTYCMDDPCAGIDFLGECDGNVAVWCDENMVRRRDCSRRGGTCEYIDDRIGYFCTR